MPEPSSPSRLGVAALVVLIVVSWLAVLRWDGAPALTPRVSGEASEESPRHTEGAPPVPVGNPTPTPRRASVRPAAAPAPHRDQGGEDPGSECGGVSSFGTCEGDVAKACVANAVYRVDCAEDGGRCAITSDGALCLPPDAHACGGTEAAVCGRDGLRRCVDGVWEDVSCERRGGECVHTHDGWRCESRSPAKPHDEQAAVELCDGHDNDLDDRVDELDVCAFVPLVAFVPEGYAPVDIEPRMQRELEILNTVYAPTEFRWAKTVAARADLRTFDTHSFGQVAPELARSALPTFYVPVLYVEGLRTTPPKAGASTLPNNRCGGVRLTDRPAPADGMIVVGEGRQPETLAHEMGHYLGLCHTHEDLEALAMSSADVPLCTRSGDAICDTPADPGPTQCAHDPACDVRCTSDPARPDASNIMSYYVGCRRVLTGEQLAEAQRNLSLRREWFLCLDPSACPCTPGGPNACPHEMSCRPGEDDGAPWSCQLDGPAVPGTSCRDSLECSGGAFCLHASADDLDSARCVRPCTQAADCDCTGIGLRFPVCTQDLPTRRAR